MAKTPGNVDDYISGFPDDTRKKLEQIRAAIQKAAPKAEEYIGYQMPAYRLNGSLVYFAGYKSHIGFYPMPSAIKAFKEDFSVYKNSKGAVQFPLDKPLPTGLITKVVKFRVRENQENAAVKKVTKKKK